MTAPMLGATPDGLRMRGTFLELAKTVDYAHAYRAIRHIVRGDGGRLAPDDVFERVLGLVLLRDAVTHGESLEVLRELADELGKSDIDEPSEADVEAIDELAALREHSCALQHVHDLVMRTEGDGQPRPFPVGAAVSIVTDKVRDVVEALNACADKLGEQRRDSGDIALDAAFAGWQRTAKGGVVRWSRPDLDGDVGLDFVCMESGPRMETLEVDEGMTVGQVAAVLALESERGLS